MARLHSKRFRLLGLALPAAFLGVLIWLGHMAAQRDRLNRSLLDAINRGDASAVRMLLDRGADANARAVPAATQTGWGRLVALFRAMLYRDNSHWTALMLASDRGQPDIARLLLERGADVNARNSDGDIALRLAAVKDNEPMVKLLLDRGANVNTRDRTGATPLIGAVSRGSAEAVWWLLDKGADVNARDRDGRPVLIWAMTAHTDSRPALVRTLLDKGADANARDAKGDTALIWAARGGYSSLVRALLASGADVNAKNRQGQTALMLAARDGYVDTVKTLLSGGADIYVTDAGGKTARMYVPPAGTVQRGQLEGDLYSATFDAEERAALLQSLNGAGVQK